MFAYILNNEIAFTSSEKLTQEQFPNISDYKILEYSDDIFHPIFENGKIKEKPHEESKEEKFARIFQNLLQVEKLDAETDHAILEGVEFSDTQIGDFIVARVFKDEKTGEPNPHAQTAMMARAMIDPEYGNSPSVLLRMKAVNDIREFFGLASMTPEKREAVRTAMRSARSV